MMITGLSAREPLDSGPVNAFREEGVRTMAKLSKWVAGDSTNLLDDRLVFDVKAKQESDGKIQ